MSEQPTEPAAEWRSSHRLDGGLGSSAEWRALVGEPVWARPTLLALIAVAGFAYAWSATGNLEIYYAAGVHSMSMSWHDFFFASFDPAGTVMLDKLPGECKGAKEHFSEAQEDWVAAARNVGVAVNQRAVSVR